MRPGTRMRCALLLLTTTTMPTGAARAEIKADAIRIGILSDMTGVYSGNGGTGSVAAARLAVDDFGSAIDGKPIMILQADDQNKADVGVGIAREWFDRQGVLGIADLVPTPVALGVEDLARQNHRIVLISGAAAESMFQENCASTAFTWVQDTYSIANATVDGVWQRTKKPWFFVNADLGPSQQLSDQAEARLKSLGGTVVGSVKAPFNTTDFSSFLLQAQAQAQASGAGVLAINTLGGTMTTMKQALEFGLNSIMTMVVTTPKSQDIIAVGLPTIGQRASIHMSDIPSFPYRLWWEERQLVSVANLTRQDGLDFLRQVPRMGLVTRTTTYPLQQANQALADLSAGRFEGAAVFVP